MGEHVIFFIDILGSSEAVKNWDKPKADYLVNLLQNFSLLQSEFSLTQEPKENGSGRAYITPAITTFSDHIVISYPIDELNKLGSGDVIGTAITFAQKHIGKLASEAMECGLLIRGGATIGELYHKKNVVVGQAMVEAYNLESKVAIYPRIVLSHKLHSQVKVRSVTRGGNDILEDYDGIKHFNYFLPMVTHVMQHSHGGEDGFEQRTKKWVEKTRRIVEENINNFESQEDLNKLAKWVWFRNTFEIMCAEAFRKILQIEHLSKEESASYKSYC